MNESSKFSAFQIAAFPKEVILLCIRKREICKLNRKYVSQFSESLINKKYDTCSSGELSEFVKREKYISQSLPSPSFVCLSHVFDLTPQHAYMCGDRWMFVRTVEDGKICFICFVCCCCCCSLLLSRSDWSTFNINFFLLNLHAAESGRALEQIWRMAQKKGAGNFFSIFSATPSLFVNSFPNFLSDEYLRCDLDILSFFSSFDSTWNPPSRFFLSCTVSTQQEGLFVSREQNCIKINLNLEFTVFLLFLSSTLVRYERTQ